ncbi:MAG: hypothetical protein Q4C25_00380 [Bacillota bacterium]|nr:hypothetical protein [Bacillota bacterium]
MKRLMKLGIVFLLLCLSSVLVLCGCGEEKSGGTIEEPDITGEYLSEEYAQQLLNDGAATMLGSVTIEDTEDGSYTVHIVEKEVIVNSSYDEGYYIADTNVTKDVPLSGDARIACLHDGELVVEDVEEFIANHEGGDADPVKLYTVYMMGESANLILATEPESVEVE